MGRSIFRSIYRFAFYIQWFFYIKNHIYLYSIEKIFFLCKNFVIQRKYIFMFNKNIFIFNYFYFHQIFVHIKNISLFNEKKHIYRKRFKRSMKLFYSMIFGSQVWSSSAKLCMVGSPTLTHVLAIKKNFI